MDAEPVIDVQRLNVWFGKRHILHDVDFRVMPGEIRVIMGGSGSGKSTLLRHLLGLLKPRSGSVRILGTDIAAASSAEVLRLRRQMGVSFQGGALFTGGMVKRAALARAIVMDPKLLFFDEPSAGLDPVVSAELDELILQLRDAMRMSIIVVTHELESAFKIADTITVLDRGHILMTGPVAAVRASDNERIQDLLNRRPRKVEVDTDEYLRRLTEAEVD